MSERHTETVTIGGGVQYAKVAARSAEFHKDNETCSIVTACEFKDGYALFTATVTTKKGTFTGHSLDKVGGKQKQFEKQETIAVGRALAFAGYLATGDIACAEEMADVLTTRQLNSLKGKFVEVYKDSLNGCDKATIGQRFNTWCKKRIGEDVDYREASSWCREWCDTCWQYLTGTSDDVPFEE